MLGRHRRSSGCKVPTCSRTIGLFGSGAFGTLPASASIPTGPTGFAGSGATGAAGTTTSSLIQTGSQHVSYQYFTTGLGFTSYELDLFGRLRSLSRQAFETALGYDETRLGTQITLVSEVANAYLTVLADRELLKLTQETFDSTSKTLDLARQILAGGANTLLAVRQAETVVETARANLS